MISLNNRIDLLCKLATYLAENSDELIEVKDKAINANAWFTINHVENAINNIVYRFLQKDNLLDWIKKYSLPKNPKTIGIVMAGNIPLVGFHDFLCGFICGHKLLIKLSTKDDILIKHIVLKLAEWQPEILEQVQFSDRLLGCDAYIATGSNNTARYFEQYFGKYPNIIRKNRTSVAILTGYETNEDLELLADDVYMYYGLGCRNVTQIYVPKDYNFERLLNLFNKHNSYADLNKYKNNYDYHLAIYLLNRVPYMSNESLLMVENDMPFSAVSVLHYKYYNNLNETLNQLKQNIDIQVIIGKNLVPFGSSQSPSLTDYSDGVDTMEFMCSL